MSRVSYPLDLISSRSVQTRPCPSCGGDFDSNDVNIAEGVALCRGCNTLVKLAALAVVPQADTSNVSVQTVPAGCWVEDRGGEAVVGTTLRNGLGYFLLLWAGFWNSIVSIFVFKLVTDWIAYFTPRGTLGDLPFRTLFFTPFVLIGVASAFFCLFNLFGKLEITIGTEITRVFRGVGPIGWTRRADTARANGAEIVKASWQQNDQDVYVIQIGKEPSIRFGSMLSDDRKKWVCVAIDAAIRARSGNARSGNAYR
jgi:hypothetical protein